MSNERKNYNKQYFQWFIAWVIGVGAILLITWLLKGDIFMLIGFPIIWTFVIGVCVSAIEDEQRKAKNTEIEVSIQTAAILRANKIMEEQKKKEEAEQRKLK